MVNRGDLTLAVPDLAGRLAAITGANSGPPGCYETNRGGATFARMPAVVRGRDDTGRVSRLSEQLTVVKYPP